MTVVSPLPPTGGTIALIRSILPSLIPSEQRVAAEFVAHPEEVALLSVADIAGRTGVSTATVIRACQNLGFKGFQHLRLMLMRDIGSTRQERSAGLDAPESDRWVPAIFDLAAHEIPGSLGALDFRAFDRAATLIAGARRVLVVGNGGSSPSAQAFALRLLTSGRSCEAPLDAITQQLTARLLEEGDVLVGVSDSGENGVTMRAVEAAHSTPATIVGVTGYARSRLGELSDPTIVGGASFSPLSEGAIAGNVVQLLLLSALQTAVARADGHAPGATEAVVDEVMQIVTDRETTE
jgi:RpiR family transcriptional regulator, carbohydrate utilization regulator